MLIDETSNATDLPEDDILCNKFVVTFDSIFLQMEEGLHQSRHNYYLGHDQPYSNRKECARGEDFKVFYTELIKD
jgi:hypothetical protein